MSPSDTRQVTQDLMAHIQKDDGSLVAHELISAYASGPGQLRDTLTHLTAEQLRARPVEGRWSILEVVRHLSDCEQFFAILPRTEDRRTRIPPNARSRRKSWRCRPETRDSGMEAVRRKGTTSTAINLMLALRFGPRRGPALT